MKKTRHKEKLAAAVKSARRDAIAEACRYLKYDMKAPAVGDAVWAALIEKPAAEIAERQNAERNAALEWELVPTKTSNVWLVA